MIRAQKGFMMQKMLDDYMIIATGESAGTFTSIIQTNETGAFYWNMIEKGTTLESMVQAAMERFIDLVETEAREDIQEFLESISPALDISEE